MESSEAFVRLREEILQHAMPLLDSEAVPADDRFRLSLQVAQTTGSLESYKKALAVAEKLDEDNKLLAYLDLLSDVDYVIQERADSTQAPAGQGGTRPEASNGEQQPTQTENSAQ